MEYNITSWLQDGINLNKKNESDLSDIIYDPRYGSLLRKFINFLAKSTLCNQKYPNVFAEQENIAKAKDLDEKYKERDDIKAKLETYISENTVLEKELSILKFKCEHYQNISTTQLETIKALKIIAKRDSSRLEQIAINMDKADEYLSNDDLIAMFKDKKIIESSYTLEASLIPNQQSFYFDEEIKTLVEKINSTFDLISSKRIDLINLIVNTVSRLKLKKKHDVMGQKIVINELPDFGDVDFEIENLKECNENLDKQLNELGQSVSNLNKTYKTKKGTIAKPYGNIVEEYFSPTVVSNGKL